MPTNNTSKTTALCAALFALLGGCATTGATQELQDARQTYANAKNSEGTQTRPDELVDARQALEAAEAAHEDEPGGVDELHLAKLAKMRAELAMSRGARTMYERDTKAKRDQLLTTAKSYASSTQEKLKSTSAEAAETKEELAHERKLRLEAESKAAAALEDLKEVAMVKEESRGYVITLSGAVLFKTGESELLQTARNKLAQVAKALADQPTDAQIVVEGHTDSRGSDSYNEGLSLSRAQAVRDYLVTEGVEANRLVAKGMGEAQPIASNETPEGRANNRRVEIVVQEGTGQHASLGQPAP